MIVIDSSGWLEILRGTALGQAYRPALSRPDELIVPTVCVAEVAQTLLRSYGDAQTLRAVSHMLRGRLVNLDASLALEAARLGCACRVPFPQNVLLSAALHNGATVWTHDESFPTGDSVRFVEGLEGGRVEPCPDQGSDVR